MKKLLLTIYILATIIVLTSCGMFNLGSWTTPDDAEFIACIEKLDIPKKISDYMRQNFTYKAHMVYAPSPYEMWRDKKGDCNDMSTFGTFVANYHGYTTWQIKIFYKGTIHTHQIAIYDEDIWLSYTSLQRYYSGFDDFRETVNCDSGDIWTKYIVYDYWDDVIEVGYND